MLRQQIDHWIWMAGEAVQCDSLQLVTAIKEVSQSSGQVFRTGPGNQGNTQAFQAQVGKHGADSRKPIDHPAWCDVKSKYFANVLNRCTDQSRR
jgi:hypothetical protein